MKARPYTTAAKKRLKRVNEKRRAGNKPSLGIPPKGKGFFGKYRLEK
jgi:hypothetical protein